MIVSKPSPRSVSATLPLAAAALAAVALLLTAAAAPVAAGGGPQGGHQHHQHQAPTPVESKALGAMSIPDPVLLDQDGREVRFYSDLVEDRVVVMNFIFTTCTTICPPMGANFAKLQKLLDARPDAADVRMISVSVDPAVDTPPRLKAWGEKFARQDGREQPRWTLVTGSKPEVDRLLKALKVFTPDKNDHSPIVLVGNDAKGEWTRAYGLAPPAKLAEMIGELVESSGGQSTEGER